MLTASLPYLAAVIDTDAIFGSALIFDCIVTARWLLEGQFYMGGYWGVMSDSGTVSADDE